MSAHTPGPWGAILMAEGSWNVINDGAVIANSPCINCDDESHANARLIAAAPDLLKALAEIESLYADLVNATGTRLTPSERGTVERARAAIAKAEGRDK